MAPLTPPTNPPSSRLRAADIGYFDPDGTDITGETVTDVFVFTDMLLHLAETQHDDIRTVFPLCLRGTALFWYSTELTPLERHLLSCVPVSAICAALISRFKTSLRFNGFNDTQMQQITQALHQVVLRNIPAPPSPSTSADKDEEDEEEDEDEEQPSTPALTTSPSTPALTTSPSTPIKSSLPPTPALTTSPSTPTLIKSSLPLTIALITSSLLPTSSLLTTTSSILTSAIYIKGQMAHLEGIG
jgi:hypothetical protein